MLTPPPPPPRNEEEARRQIEELERSIREHAILMGATIITALIASVFIAAITLLQ